MNVDALPVKVMHEYLVCQYDKDVRCRKRAIVYMDGAQVCRDHLDSIAPFLLQFAKKIKYEVSR